MAKNYEVNYQINVNSEAAIQSINKFQDATMKLDRLAKRFEFITTQTGKVTAALRSLNSTSATVNINTSKAESSLNRLVSLLATIKAEAASVNGVVTNAKNNVAGTPSTQYLRALRNSIDSTQTAITNLNKRRIHPKARTGTAEQSLQRLIDKLVTISSMSNITITATAAGTSGAVQGGATSGSGATAAAAAVGATSSGKTPKAPKPKLQAGHSKYLYPTTRQVLGPTYAGSGTTIGGEMIKGMGVAYGLSTLFSGVSQVFKDATDYNNISQTTKNILETHDTKGNFAYRFNNMNQLLRRVGVETKFTAPQVAEAGKFLAMAGMNVEEIKNAIRPITDIALIGDTDLGETADVVTNIMTGYEIPSQLMSNAADVLTMTFTKTNTTLMELAESFKYAGTIAKQAGVSFETSSAAFGILGNAGIKGSHAGTTLRMMINNMLNPNEKQSEAWDEVGVNTRDANGNLRNFADIMSDLNKKSKEMSSGQFTSLIGRMFRITALPGALALIRNADNIKTIIDKNYSSMGLSSSLAEEKKNTVQGLWYQMTSAFTETGMKGFEEMQGVIKEFLMKMTSLMKSSDFAKGLKEMMGMLIEILKHVASIVNAFTSIWSAIPSFMKDAFVMFVKIQMVGSIISGIGKSILSTFLLVRGVLLGQWMAKIVNMYTSLFLGVKKLFVMFLLYRRFGLSPIQSFGRTIGKGVFASLSNVGVNTAAGAVGAAGTGAVAAGTEKVFTPLGILSSFLSKLFTNYATLAGIGVASIAAIGYQIYDTITVTKQARIENDNWIKSYRNLGVEKMSLSNPDDLMIANMRIYNNTLLSHQEKVNQAADAWHRYWKEKNGPKDTNDDITKYIDTAEGGWFKSQLEAADAWFNVHKSFEGIAEELGGVYKSFVTTDNYGKQTGRNALVLNGQYIPINSGNKIGEIGAVQLMFSRMGADPNNERRMKLEQYLNTAVTSSTSYSDLQNIINYARNNFLPKYGSWDSRWNNISSEEAREMSKKDIESSQAYILALRKNMETVFSYWNSFAELIKDSESGAKISPLRVQKILHERFGILFDEKYGLFGSDSWVTNVQKELSKMPSNEATDLITHTFDQLLNWYNLLGTKYKPLFSQFLNRTMFEQLLPDPGRSQLTAGGFNSGKSPGDTMMVNGVKYTWRLQGPTGNYVWTDDNGNIYTPSNSNFVPSTGGLNSTGIPESIHNGSDESQYKSHYKYGSSAPKQIIVKIENLMHVDNQMIDMNDGKQVAAINNIKQELATALLEVVQDFNANIS